MTAISTLQVLCEKSTTTRGAVKRLIIRNRLLPYQCSMCGLGPLWRGMPMPLVLDHINGVNDDHRLSNLRFVCSNCDTQLPTYKAKNRVKDKPCMLPEVSINTLRLTQLPCSVKVDRFCSYCGAATRAKTKKCRKCSKAKKDRPTKIVWPSNEELAKLVKTHTLRKLGSILGVSDKSVKKRCKTRGIPVVDHRRKVWCAV